ncbi:hypothetical protein [Mucilaginibacter sp.]|uniref:hypothetical protein n=1 Tax=Mucilaginibacter sp. TaxID=1882438 RepID=UPI003265BA17
MTIKLTYDQAKALEHLFINVINPEEPADVAEKLVKHLMTAIFKKLRNKLESKVKDGYSLALTDTEAMAYYIYFQQRHLGLGWLYEQNFIDRHILELDKQYA